MKIIDKYILGRFLKIIAVSLLAFILIFVIVDLIENVDKYIDHNAPAFLVFLYYLYYIPFIIVLALPIAVLLSTMFTVGSLARYHELEVMKATGLSLYRLSAPILIAGFCISVAVMLFTEFVVVPANNMKDTVKNEKIEQRQSSEGRILRDVIKAGDKGWIVYARVYNEREEDADNVVIQQILDNQVKVALKAKKMAWQDSTWLLFGVTRRVFEDDNEVEFNQYDSLFAGFLPQTPAVMKHRQKDPRDTRFFELLDRIKLKKLMKQDTAKDQVELYLKVSFPFFNFVIIILGIPLAANPRRSGGSVGFGLSVIISFIYFVILRAGNSLGYNHDLPPFLAATIGNIIFLVIGSAMFLKARK